MKYKIYGKPNKEQDIYKSAFYTLYGYYEYYIRNPEMENLKTFLEYEYEV